jgi:hypothetical protein
MHLPRRKKTGSNGLISAQNNQKSRLLIMYSQECVSAIIPDSGIPWSCLVYLPGCVIFSNNNLLTRTHVWLVGFWLLLGVI